MNQDLLKEIIKQDYHSKKTKIQKFLVNEVKKRESDGVIFGLSGGMDSAVVADYVLMF